MDPSLLSAQAAFSRSLPPSPDDYATNPTFLASQEELRSLLFNTAQSTHPTRAPSPDSGGAGYVPEVVDGVGAAAASTSGQNQMKQILGTRKRVEYLKNYIAKVATWVSPRMRLLDLYPFRCSPPFCVLQSACLCMNMRTISVLNIPTPSIKALKTKRILLTATNQLDMFDSSRHFGIYVPALAQTQPPLLYAILALSARHMERLSGSASLRRGSKQNQHYPASCESLELYQEAIRLLTPKLPERSPHILTCCVILCCLEMMSASPQDWRRHLEGCATLFDSFDVNGFSGGLMQAVFWCYVRMGECLILLSQYFFLRLSLSDYS